MPQAEGSPGSDASLRIHRHHVFLFAIFALAVAFRLHDIDELDVWIDEANAILTAGH